MTTIIGSLTTTFNRANYAAFFRLKGVPMFFQILKSSGLIEEMIERHPTMKLSKERYMEAVDSIIHFHENRTMID